MPALPPPDRITTPIASSAIAGSITNAKTPKP
jgi:hypothetical protein